MRRWSRSSVPREALIAAAAIVGAVTTTIARHAVASHRVRGNLLDEQAALRRVATQVARGAAPSDVFAAVAGELARLFGAEAAVVAKLDDSTDTSVTIVGSYNRSTTTSPVGARLDLLRGRLARAALDAGQPIQVGDEEMAALRLGHTTGIAVPIVVGSRVWGLTVVGSTKGFLPGAESRIASFVGLAAMAISNTEADERVTRLAEVQAALRRIALLIAKGEPPEQVFAAVSKEVLRHFGDGGTVRLTRYEPDDTVTLLAHAGTPPPQAEIGQTWDIARPPEGLSETVRRTGRPARVDDYRRLDLDKRFVREGLISAVGMPVHVNGRLWGLIALGSKNGPLPPDLENRMTEFTDLVATAVADAQSRAELTNSRARIVAAADEARRRIERDLHDGVQQSLVSLALRLRSASADSEVHDEVAEDLITAIDQLRELSHGIHPAILSDSGLPAALRALSRRSPLPMKVDVRIDGRLPMAIEVAAYYVVTEMLTNAAKHAHASAVEVEAEVVDGVLTLRVRDDGIGGADPRRGSGLVGLKDRIEALGGTFDVHSPPGEGTTVTCLVPIPR